MGRYQPAPNSLKKFQPCLSLETPDCLTHGGLRNAEEHGSFGGALCIHHSAKYFNVPNTHFVPEMFRIVTGLVT
ncbi:hypothetical protein BC2230_40512 [Burkholderia cepacia]